jgi:hypothetical protein
MPELFVIIAVPASVALAALSFVGVIGLAGQSLPAERERPH